MSIWTQIRVWNFIMNCLIVLLKAHAPYSLDVIYPEYEEINEELQKQLDYHSYSDSPY